MGNDEFRALVTEKPLGVGVFHMGKVFPNDDIFRKLFFFTYFNQTELKGWRFRGICSYIYISILCILILLYLEPFLGILQKISSIYIMR